MFQELISRLLFCAVFFPGCFSRFLFRGDGPFGRRELIHNDYNIVNSFFLFLAGDDKLFGRIHSSEFIN
jgi:hypothetical protein